MRLDGITFDPDQRPEAQHQLQQRIPPSERVDHPELRTALERYEQARKDEHEARLTHTQLEQELPAAEHKDEVALADSREKGKADPGPRNADRHRKAIAEAKRDWGARKIALSRAVESVVAAFDAHGGEWEAALIEERDELRSAMSELLDGWARLHQKLQANSANRAIARGSAGQSPSLFVSAFKVPRVQDGDVVDVADVIEGLRGLAAPQEPSQTAVENVEAGADPTKHRPPAKQPHFSGGEAVAIGGRSDPGRLREWQERDEAEARAAGEALAAERRAAREVAVQ